MELIFPIRNKFGHISFKIGDYKIEIRNYRLNGDRNNATACHF